jgi:hypothetical protein
MDDENPMGYDDTPADRALAAANAARAAGVAAAALREHEESVAAFEALMGVVERDAPARPAAYNNSPRTYLTSLSLSSLARFQGSVAFHNCAPAVESSAATAGVQGVCSTRPKHGCQCCGPSARGRVSMLLTRSAAKRADACRRPGPCG